MDLWSVQYERAELFLPQEIIGNASLRSVDCGKWLAEGGDL